MLASEVGSSESRDQWGPLGPEFESLESCTQTIDCVHSEAQPACLGQCFILLGPYRIAVHDTDAPVHQPVSGPPGHIPLGGLLGTLHPKRDPYTQVPLGQQYRFPDQVGLSPRLTLLNPGQWFLLRRVLHLSHSS